MWTHLFRVKKWVLDERNIAIWASWYGLGTNTAFDAKYLSVASTMHRLFFIMVLNECKWLCGVYDRVTRYASKAIIMILLVKRVDGLLHRPITSSTHCHGPWKWKCCWPSSNSCFWGFWSRPADRE
jgi:hypothetical protein